MAHSDTRSRASIQFSCPNCEEESHCAAGLASEAAPRSCPGCGWTLAAKGTPPDGHSPVVDCWVCGNQEFFIQKDFNRQFGFLIVVTSFTIILLVMLLFGHLLGIYCLFGLAAVDYAVYRLLGNVTVCYLCNTIYRGFPLHPGHKGFYLGTEEAHKRLRRVWLTSLEAGGGSVADDSRDVGTEVADATERS